MSTSSASPVCSCPIYECRVRVRIELLWTQLSALHLHDVRISCAALCLTCALSACLCSCKQQVGVLVVPVFLRLIVRAEDCCAMNCILYLVFLPVLLCSFAQASGSSSPPVAPKPALMNPFAPAAFSYSPQAASAIYMNAPRPQWVCDCFCVCKLNDLLFSHNFS